MRGESGTLQAGEEAESRGLRGEVAVRRMVMLRVTWKLPGAVAAEAEEEEEEGEKEEYLRSLPRPESGRGPATVSSHRWSRRLILPLPCSNLPPIILTFTRLWRGGIL